MTTVKLYAYLKKNLGDDLMVYILLNRYPQYRFFCDGYGTDETFQKCPNFCAKETFYKKYGRLNHLLNILTLNKFNFFNKFFQKLENRISCAVYIGGSLFMQDTQTDIEKRLSYERTRMTKWPLYIIGANFGPYQTESFRIAFESYFADCAGVTFRDRKSFGLFKHLPNVNYAPDVVFNLNPACEQKASDCVLISVIDIEKRLSISQYAEQYDRFIADVCIETAKRGKTPVLMSFCKYEGDEDAITRIYNKLPKAVQQATDTFFYDGNLELALQQFERAERVVATRFHAMILALCFNKPVFSVSYNSKVKNVLDDMGIQAYCDISEVDSVNIKMIFDGMPAFPDISDYKAEAAEQFAQFERYMTHGM